MQTGKGFHLKTFFAVTLVIGTGLCLLVYRLKMPTIPTVQRPPMSTSLHLQKPEHKLRYKKILLWTTYFANPKWPGEWHRYFSQCPVLCTVTRDRSQVTTSDALVFHIQYRALHVDEMPSFRAPQQRYIFFTRESPTSNFLDLTPYDNNFFNWTMTYSHTSDIFYPYASTTKSTWRSSSSIADLIREKDRQILWLVSECNTNNHRWEHVIDMKRHGLVIDTFGKCGKADPCKSRYGSCALKLRHRYKFYLALENSDCHDYITEKFWKALRDGMVPIVMGAELEEYKAVAPPNSFIHIDQFHGSINFLAEHIHKLNENDTLYASYLAWRDSYSINFSLQKYFCKLCEKLHTNSTPKSYPRISEWWSEEKECWNAF